MLSIENEVKPNMDEKFDDMKGRVKEAAGDLTDNEDLEREGKLDQFKATAKDAIDNIGDKVKGIINRD